MTRVDDARRLVAELLGTALLLVAIVGSGLAVAADGSGSSQLFQHAVVVGAALVVLILVFGPVSGAHFNPAVTVADWWFGGIPTRRAVAYVFVQLLGAVLGTVGTHLMFGVSAVATSGNLRADGGAVAAEGLATAGLLLVIFALVRRGAAAVVPAAVGLYIAVAISSTASAAFANPAVTLARALSPTWTGIAWSSVPGFLAGQALGVLAAVALIAWLFAPDPADARDVLVPHGEDDDPTHVHVPDRRRRP